MPLYARCPNGHQWEIPLGNQSQSDATLIVCPVCGSYPTNTDTFPSLTAPTLESEKNTHSDSDVSLNAKTITPSPAVSKEDIFDSDTYINEDMPAPQMPSKHGPLPGYELLDLIGRGGMGVVYKARDVKLQRLVALKMLHAGVTPPKTLVRFQAEAQAIAHLTHPHIVQIFEIGEVNEQPFLALEYVEGGSLSRKLRRTSFSPRRAAQLIETLAHAVHYAHEQGILHRDLKPGNILLATDGTPKITDFGLAKRLVDIQRETGEAKLTETGEILGTPSYMAPEQAVAQGTIGRPTDVYALGAILYELLAHQPPFEADTPMLTVMEVLEKDPIPPQKLQPGVPRDLQTICLMCLEKNPAYRYTTAVALARDLNNFLTGEPIQAKRPSPWQRFRLAMRRRPVHMLGVGILLAALLGIFVGVFFFQPLAVVGLAVVMLLAAAGWYNTRLQRALHRVDEQQLQAERNIERLKLLLETTQDLMRADTLDELLYLLSETTTRMAGAERATVFLIDHKQGELWSKVALGEDVGEIRIKLGEGIAGHVAKSGETINLADPYADARFNPEIDKRTGYTTRNLLTFPMRASTGYVIGVFQVLNKRQGAFEPDDLHLLQSLAASAAVVVEKAQQKKL